MDGTCFSWAWLARSNTRLKAWIIFTLLHSDNHVNGSIMFELFSPLGEAKQMCKNTQRNVSKIPNKFMTFFYTSVILSVVYMSVTWQMWDRSFKLYSFSYSLKLKLGSGDQRTSAVLSLCLQFSPHDHLQQDNRISSGAQGLPLALEYVCQKSQLDPRLIWITSDIVSCLATSAARHAIFFYPPFHVSHHPGCGLSNCREQTPVFLCEWPVLWRRAVNVPLDQTWRCDKASQGCVVRCVILHRLSATSNSKIWCISADNKRANTVIFASIANSHFK